VVNAGRCLEIGEDGVARLYKLKDAAKKEWRDQQQATMRTADTSNGTCHE
jgi:hypothetical protein